jgi:cell division protease FtsH
MRELDKVIGYDSIKQELYKIIDIFQNPEKYKALGVSAPNGIMLDGDPGIGKTLMAKSIIKESGRKSFVIRKDRSDGEFVDYIRKVFEQAENEAPSIVLLDDLDKFAAADLIESRFGDAFTYIRVVCRNQHLSCKIRQVFERLLRRFAIRQ